MKKIVFIFFLLFVVLYAQSDFCKTQWIQSNGKKYIPPESVEILKITFINDLDSIELSTKSQTSKYEYKSFLDIKGQLGVSYQADNGDLLDIFQNGNLIIWRNRIPTLKAFCPTLKLEIQKNK